MSVAERHAPTIEARSLDRPNRLTGRGRWRAHTRWRSDASIEIDQEFLAGGGRRLLEKGRVFIRDHTLAHHLVGEVGQ